MLKDDGAYTKGAIVSDDPASDRYASTGRLKAWVDDGFAEMGVTEVEVIEQPPEDAPDPPSEERPPEILDEPRPEKKRRRRSRS